ncbi:MAG: hemerythrin domain-containing protein [Gammaproteobacteria bacterium]
MREDPFPRPAPSFDDPLGMLEACHERILRHCDLLGHVARAVMTGPLDDQARAAAAAVLRYFSTAGLNHHADEERDLFPLLEGRTPELDQLIMRLCAEHQAMNTRWAALEPSLREPNEIRDAAAFRADAEAFQRMYRAHVELENAQLLPRVRVLLDPAACAALGRAMAHRRSV